MKIVSICCLLLLSGISVLQGQTLNEAKELYQQGQFAQALPTIEAEYNAKPTDASLNQWYGVCLFETGGDMLKAEECLVLASKKRIQEAFFYLGQLYTSQYRFTEANEAYNKFESLLKKKDEENHKRLEEKRAVTSRLHRMVSNTEDIQIIDSIVVDKASFLSAYKMSLSTGKLDYFNNVFSANRKVESTVYFNEKGTKIYYGQPAKDRFYTLFSMEKLLDEFGNEKVLSSSNFGLKGDVNYPFIMADGVTIYFAAKDEDSVGGYDLFASRYNLNNDTYLTPERLNMPFNSQANDYMMVIDEEKGVGWFASDRMQPEGKVCVYTFIPNATMKTIASEDEALLAGRARISSIKSSWIAGKDYSKLIALARKTPVVEVKAARDFEFVIDDVHTYYTLEDFKNKMARDTYYNVVQLSSELKSLQEKLENERMVYTDADQSKRRQMSASILAQEKRVEQLQKDIPLLEVKARNQELQSLK